MLLSGKKFRLAILASHPIEYQGPLFEKLAREPGVDLHVYYCWKFGVEKETLDPGFNRSIKWDIPLLEGYSWSFLKNFSLNPSGRFFGEINPGIITKISRKRHDALLVLGWSSMTSWFAYLYAWLRGVPFFIRGENPLNQEFGKPPWKRIFKRPILKFLFRRAAGIFYIGQGNREFYEYYGAPKEKLVFVPYAVDNDRFLKAAKDLLLRKNQLKKKMGIPPSKIVILFAGKLIHKKRPLDLVRAYHKLKKENRDIALVFLGDGPLRGEVEGYVKERGLKDVYITGFKNQTEMPEGYALGDVFVLPSGFGETWGLVVNEAMCFGLPIIVSDMVGSAPDLIKEGYNGFIFHSGNFKELAEKLDFLLKNRDKARALGRNSLKFIEHYSYEKDIQGILSALNYVSK